MAPVLVIGKKPVPAPVVLPGPKRSPRKVKELDKKATGQEVGWGPEFCGPNILQTGTLGWNLGRNGALYQSQLKARGIGSTTAVWTMAPTRLKWTRFSMILISRETIWKPVAFQGPANRVWVIARGAAMRRHCSGVAEAQRGWLRLLRQEVLHWRGPAKRNIHRCPWAKIARLGVQISEPPQSKVHINETWWSMKNLKDENLDCFFSCFFSDLVSSGPLDELPKSGSRQRCPIYAQKESKRVIS